MPSDSDHEGNINAGPKIVVLADGPYKVQGDIPLVRKTQVISEYGEPLTWKKEETIETADPYVLCRCGHSHDKPFCDATHWEIPFDAAEGAATGPTAERQQTCAGGTHIVVRCDAALCTGSGFCGNRVTSVERMVPDTGDTQVRAQVMAMIERCPSGALTYAVEPDQADVEPDLPRQIAVVTEITAGGPITGPLWVTGCVPIERADGRPLEARNRVLLCGCGLSKNKPLCDGTHRAASSKED